MMPHIRRYFISGLLVWVPIWVIVLGIKFLGDLLSNILLLLPKNSQPDVILGFHIPGIGIVVTLTVIFLTGMIAANFMGKRVVEWWDALIGRIPLVSSVHAGVKQVLQTVLTPEGQSFRKVFLVEYPLAGTWTIAFQTGDATPAVQNALGGEMMVSLYVPTTPNPTSGFLLMVPRRNIIELNMSVEQALKFVISLGVMQPIDDKKFKKKFI